MRRNATLLLCLLLALTVTAAERDTQGQPLRLNAVKTTFLSWITGSTKIAYERAWPDIHQSSELAIVMIGAGADKYKNHPLGFSARYAHKFFLAGNKRQPLTGFYLRPEIIYSGYDYDSKDTGQRTRSDMGSLMGTLGFQYDWNHFIIDAHIGCGYAWGTPADTHYQHGFSLWDYFDHYNPNISMTLGIRLGYSF